MRPTLTISIPTFNRLNFLKTTLKSVFSQSQKPDELIVVDNYSTDGTWEYLQELKSLKVFRNRQNLGMIGNWNESLKRAKSDFVVCLHSDDMILPDYVKAFKQKLTHLSRKVAAYLTAGYFINRQGKILGIRKPFAEDRLFYPRQAIRNFWQVGSFYLLASGWTVFNRKILAKLGYYSKRFGLAAEDEMTFKILPYYPVFYSAKPLFAVRSHVFRNFETEIKEFTLDKEEQNLENQCRFLLEFEKEAFIKQAFTEKENRQRWFLRKPLSHLLAQALYYLMLGDLARFKLYGQTFWRYFPPPRLGRLTFKLLLWWWLVLTKRRMISFWAKWRYEKI